MSIIQEKLNTNLSLSWSITIWPKNENANDMDVPVVKKTKLANHNPPVVNSHNPVVGEKKMDNKVSQIVFG